MTLGQGTGSAAGQNVIESDEEGDRDGNVRGYRDVGVRLGDRIAGYPKVNRGKVRMK